MTLKAEHNATSAPRARRRGRPTNGDSAKTRARLINAARECFALRGFDLTTVGDVARAADVVPSAFYYYFKGKDTLYEAVFEETVGTIWSTLEAPAVQCPSLGAAIRQLVAAAAALAEERPYHSAFLIDLAGEGIRRSEFAWMMAHRTRLQRHTFLQLADLGLNTGELTGGRDQLAEQLRLIVVGWMTERHVSGAQELSDVDGLLRLLRL